MMMFFCSMVSLGFAEVPKTIPLPHIRGKELYDDLCFQCHGTVGLADTPLAVSMNAPALAGQFTTGEYAVDIKLVQEGNGLMPSYEMVIDKHDTKRILIYLGGLDPETGIDPRIKEGIKEETEEENEGKTEESADSKKSSNKIQKTSSVPGKPKKPTLEKSSLKKLKPKSKPKSEEQSEKKSETIP